MNSLPAKTCTKCGELKLLTEYKPRRTSPDGHRSECRSCSNEYNRDRYASSPEVRESAHKWQRENPDLARVNKVKWEVNNKDTVDLKNAKYREANRGKTRAASTAWRLRNKDRQSAAERRRRARKLQNGWELYTEAQVLDQYGTACHLCTKEVDLEAPRRVGHLGWELSLHIDHVIPIAKGGPDSLDNVRPAHALCNIKKGDRI